MRPAARAFLGPRVRRVRPGLTAIRDRTGPTGQTFVRARSASSAQPPTRTGRPAESVFEWSIRTWAQIVKGVTGWWPKRGERIWSRLRPTTPRIRTFPPDSLGPRTHWTSARSTRLARSIMRPAFDKPRRRRSRTKKSLPGSAAKVCKVVRKLRLRFRPGVCRSAPSSQSWISGSRRLRRTGWCPRRRAS